MTTNQEITIRELESRLGWDRRKTERFGAELVPGIEAGKPIEPIDADHLILLMSDADVRQQIWGHERR